MRKDSLIALVKVVVWVGVLVGVMFGLWLCLPPSQGDCGVPAGGCTTPDGVYHEDSCFNYEECIGNGCEWHWSWIQNIRC